ncbi:DnaA N-terminal domain-containing protein [Jannaschia helgolandensis]|uniref:DnaA N-terminal domain-containing protein n=1 Tax=Jannaschia helgolandensis TaxID=188906 RepID=UPI0030DCF85C|tara:strand:+ start:488 stop:1153 length:666 start_codon:yes stop_codon:yes gene_type:complete
MKRRETTRATGRYAASLKYDVLTALGAYACGGDKHRQRLALRLMTLVTARYNWQDDTVTTGQREIAALWSVDERTVKREMARLREMGWLVLKRASTRGRVACYGLGLDVILMQTEPYWVCVGPDFVERMGAKPAEPASDPTVVAFPVAGEGAWSQIATRLQADDPGVFNAWFAPLVSLGERNRVLRLKVPSKFHGSFLRTHHLGRLQALARFQGCEVELVD